MGCDKPDDELFCAVPDGFRPQADEQKHDVARQNWNSVTADRSAPAVMPEVDHRIGKGLEGIVQLTETIKAKQ